MEMSQIRYVLSAAEHLNFTVAAEACNVSQPALTKGIKKLEHSLGAPIFHREGKRILVSDFGNTMLPHLRQIMQEAETAQELAQNFRLLNQAPLKLGVMSTIGHLRLARFLARFETSFSGIELSVQETSPDTLRRDLADGKIDVAVMTQMDDMTSEQFRIMPLYQERYVVVIPPGHHLGALNQIALKDLSGERYVDRLACELREMVMAVCESRGVELYAKFRSEREDWVQAMVLAGFGFAFMPEYSVTLPGLIQRPLGDPEVSRQISLFTIPGRQHTPALSAMMRAAHAFDWPG